MKPLLVILGYQNAKATIYRHWKYYEASGCDIMGVGRVDKHVDWPYPIGERSFVFKCDIGVDSYVNGDNLPKQFVDLLAVLLDAPALKDYPSFFITEHDAIFTGPIPDRSERHDEDSGLWTIRAAGGLDANFRGENCFHPPWWIDRYTAWQMCMYGRRMLKARLIENGFPDRFIGLMADLYSISWKSINGFSVNLIDRPEYVACARSAIIDDKAFYVHGIKTAQQLQAVTEGLPCANLGA